MCFPPSWRVSTVGYGRRNRKKSPCGNTCLYCRYTSTVVDGLWAKF